MSPFLLGAGAMFATMYSTQAILPQLGDSFGVSPAEAGLTISVLVVALAVGAWIWGPLSDRIGLRRSLTLASAILVVPAIVVPLAPTFALLLVARAAEGLVMPGLLTVGVGYIADVYKPRIGSRAMGYYVSTLVVGGLVGRLGVAFLTDLYGWRWAMAVLALLPAIAAIVVRRSLEADPVRHRPEPVSGARLALLEESHADRCLRRRGEPVLRLRRGVLVHRLPVRGRAVLVLALGRQPDLHPVGVRGGRPGCGHAVGPHRLAPGRLGGGRGGASPGRCSRCRARCR